MKTIITFLKNWTLPSAIVSGTVIYLIFYWIPALDPVSEVMEPIFDTILPLFMSLILFTTFLRVDFHKMRPAMWHLWVSVFQVVLVILLVALIIGFDMKGKDLILMEGILTCVICPGASAAPVVTGKLGGNLETMTSYVFLSNIVTVVAVPVVFPTHRAARAVAASASLLLSFFMVWTLSMNISYHQVRQEDLWLYRFRDYIAGSGVEAPGILNMNCFDAGLYTVTDATPVCYYFQTQTLNMEEVIDVQKACMRTDAVDFILSRDISAEGLRDRYELVLTDEIELQDFCHTYYLNIFGFSFG